MELLKRKNCWLWFLLLVSSLNGVVLSTILNLYKKDAWYTNYKYWILGFFCGFFPGIIMIIVFLIESLCMGAKKLDIPGSEVYTSPYTWLLCLIFPIIGWTLMLIMLAYLNIWVTLYICQGKGEKFIK